MGAPPFRTRFSCAFFGFCRVSSHSSSLKTCSTAMTRMPKARWRNTFACPLTYIERPPWPSSRWLLTRSMPERFLKRSARVLEAAQTPENRARGQFPDERRRRREVPECLGQKGLEVGPAAFRRLPVAAPLVPRGGEVFVQGGTTFNEKHTVGVGGVCGAQAVAVAEALWQPSEFLPCRVVYQLRWLSKLATLPLRPRFAPQSRPTVPPLPEGRRNSQSEISCNMLEKRV